MDGEYCLNRSSGRIVKIGSICFRKIIQRKLKRQNMMIYKESVSPEEYHRCKGTLPKITSNYYYSYSRSRQTIEIRRKTYSEYELLALVASKLDNIIARYKDISDMNSISQKHMTIVQIICSEIIE